MDMFQTTGEARLLAHEGQRQMAMAIAAKVRGWFAQFKAWQESMPVTLPPTEARPR